MINFGDHSQSTKDILVPGQRIKPDLSTPTAVKLITDYFDFSINKITELNSYDDRNYFVQGTKNNGDGKIQKFVFKVLNSIDSGRNHVAAQNAAMTFLHSRGICCPVPKASLHDGSQCPLVQIPAGVDAENNVEKSHIIRLLSFVEGDILKEVNLTETLLFEAGYFLAKILSNLKDFRHVDLESYNSIWSLSSVPTLTRFIYVIESDKMRYELVREVLEAFNNRVVPAYSKLEKGVIHGDFNEGNIIVKKIEKENGTTNGDNNKPSFTITGIIDFADLQENYYLFDLAIALTYLMLECLKTEIDPFNGSTHVLNGYLQILTVSSLEVELLRICIASRLCQSLVLGQYSFSHDPTNTHLIYTANKGWDLLDRIWNKTSDLQLYNIWKKGIPTLP